MKIAVRRILMLGALMSPTALCALGLGDIRLKSALNQPFDAEIQLVDATDEDLSTLRASIAPGETFTRYGLDRPAFLSDFSFEVTRGASGRDVLRVTSARPVTEPFVTFLIDATWPRGRLLREYTVLLDPPVFAPGPATAETPVATPRATTGAAAPAPAPAPAPSYAAPPDDRPRSAAPAPTSGAAATSIEPGSTYHVQPNDTLWQIASGAYPGSRSDVNRAMLAIYQANPRAFEGNINVLRAGSKLAMPDAAAVGQISARSAAAEVARQHQQWREGSGGAAQDAEARLRLVTPEQGSAAASTAAPSAAAGAGATELQARVQQLEAELAEARRLLEVRNAELATLQGQAAPPTPVEEPATPSPAGTTAAEPPVAEAPSTEFPIAEPPVAEPAPAPVAEEPEPEPAQVAAPAAQEPAPSLLDRLMKYWWAIAALLLGLLALVFLRRRQREQGAAADSFDDAFTQAGDLRERPVRVSPGREGEILVEEKRPVEPLAPRPRPVPVAPAPAPAPADSARRPVSLDDTLSSDAAVNIEAGDPLAEADFHMAYGLYDQAADLVQLAIKREPQRRDLKLKLLEIYFVWGNRDRFVEVARAMRPERASMSPGEWDKVLIMGKQIAPEDVLFAESEPAGATSVDMELAATQGLTDLDFLADAPESTTTDIDLRDVAEEETAGTGIDFLLDEPLRGADLASLAPTIESARLADSTESTAEVELENLGLDVGDLAGLEDAEDLLAPPARAQVEDTVERPLRPPPVEDTIERPIRPNQVEDTIEQPRTHRASSAASDQEDTLRRRAVRGDAATTPEDEEDTLKQTGIMRSPTTTLRIPKTSDGTGVMPALDQELGDGTGVMPVLDPTGEVPTIETTRMQKGLDVNAAGVDFVLGDEPATMSEVGTKLDLARAYIDMGDPEGARSILEEVLQEGSNTQKQEAERLMSSLP
jgi:pilus assembly protein FimV